MGFFAQCCSKCGKSVVSSYKVQDRRAQPWEATAMVYLPDGSTLEGVYDGYGRVGGHDLTDPWVWDDIKIVHAKCVDASDTFADLPESENCPLQGFWDE